LIAGLDGVGSDLKGMIKKRKEGEKEEPRLKGRKKGKAKQGETRPSWVFGSERKYEKKKSSAAKTYGSGRPIPESQGLYPSYLKNP